MSWFNCTASGAPCSSGGWSFRRGEQADARGLVACGFAVFTRRLARDRLARFHDRALARHGLGGQRGGLGLVLEIGLGRRDLFRRR